MAKAAMLLIKMNDVFISRDPYDLDDPVKRGSLHFFTNITDWSLSALNEEFSSIVPSFRYIKLEETIGTTYTKAKLRVIIHGEQREMHDIYFFLRQNKDCSHVISIIDSGKEISSSDWIKKYKEDEKTLGRFEGVRVKIILLLEKLYRDKADKYFTESDLHAQYKGHYDDDPVEKHVFTRALRMRKASVPPIHDRTRKTGLRFRKDLL